MNENFSRGFFFRFRRGRTRCCTLPNTDALLRYAHVPEREREQSQRSELRHKAAVVPKSD